MELFYIVFFFLLFGTFIKPINQKLYFYLSFILLFVISAFRSKEVGTDALAYERIFYNISNDIEGRHEIFWVILNKSVSFFSGSFQGVIFVTTLLVLLSIFYVAKKFSENPMLSVFLFYSLYFYLHSFNILRQAVAVCICLLALVYLFKNRKIYFILFILLASGFHITAIILLPLVYVNKLPKTNVFYLACIVLSVLIGLFYSQILSRFMLGVLNFDSYESMLQTELRVTHVFFILLNNLFFIYILTLDKEKSILFKLFFVSFIVSNILGFIPYAYRINLFFMIIQVLYFPYLLKMDQLKGNFSLRLIILLYASLTFFSVLGSGGIITYSNLLF